MILGFFQQRLESRHQHWIHSCLQKMWDGIWRKHTVHNEFRDVIFNAMLVEKGRLSYGQVLVEMSFHPREDDFFLTVTYEESSKEGGLSGDLQNPTETFVRWEMMQTIQIQGWVSKQHSLTSVVDSSDATEKCVQVDPATPEGMAWLASQPPNHIIQKNSLCAE